MKNSLRYFIVLSVLALSSCIPKEENPPVYLKIDKVDFDYTNTSVTGMGGTNISDVWIYIDDDLMGLFELPAVIPMAYKGGSQKISIGPGIKENGIASTRVEYYFYKRWEITNPDLQPFDTVLLEPVTSYHDGIKFVWKEDFENINTTIDTLPSSDVKIERVQVSGLPLYFGNFISRIEMPVDSPAFKAFTSVPIFIPSDVGPVYLEMDYRCNQVFHIGLVVKKFNDIPREEPFIGLNSTEQEPGEYVWNKIYIDLTQIVSGRADVEYFGISFTAYRDNKLVKGFIEMDNLKILYP